MAAADGRAASTPVDAPARPAAAASADTPPAGPVAPASLLPVVPSPLPPALLPPALLPPANRGIRPSCTASAVMRSIKSEARICDMRADTSVSSSSGASSSSAVAPAPPPPAAAGALLDACAEHPGPVVPGWPAAVPAGGDAAAAGPGAVGGGAAAAGCDAPSLGAAGAEAPTPDGMQETRVGDSAIPVGLRVCVWFVCLSKIATLFTNCVVRRPRPLASPVSCARQRAAGRWRHRATPAESGVALRRPQHVVHSECNVGHTGVCNGKQVNYSVAACVRHNNTLGVQSAHSSWRQPRTARRVKAATARGPPSAAGRP